MMRSAALAVIALLFVVPVRADQTTQAGDVVAGQQGNDIRFTLITTRGYVSFSVNGDWPVIGMQSRPPATATAFQLPDAADAGTPDSTNLVVNLFTPGTPQGDAAIANIGVTRNSAAPVTTEQRGGWTIYSQESHQGQTPYTVLDARATESDVVCAMRLAWPHLKNHDANYDARMRALFDTVLASIGSGLGPYSVPAGAVVRRPDPE